MLHCAIPRILKTDKLVGLCYIVQFLVFPQWVKQRLCVAIRTFQYSTTRILSRCVISSISIEDYIPCYNSSISSMGERKAVCCRSQILVFPHFSDVLVLSQEVLLDSTSPQTAERFCCKSRFLGRALARRVLLQILQGLEVLQVCCYGVMSRIGD